MLAQLKACWIVLDLVDLKNLQTADVWSLKLKQMQLHRYEDPCLPAMTLESFWIELNLDGLELRTVFSREHHQL